MGLYLSYSGMTTYLDCSEKWWWAKQGWVEKETPEALGLGSVFHESVAEHFKLGDPLDVYEKRIREVFKGVPGRDLLTLGPYMLGKLSHDPTFLKLKSTAIELNLKKPINSTVTLVGVVDFIGTLDGKRVVIDWKTASNPYDEEFYNAMADQLIAYKILTQGTQYEVDRFGYCVVGKKEFGGKQGDPQWFFLDEISPERIKAFEQKLTLVAGRMARGEHFKQGDERKCIPKAKWQPGCIFYELCLGKPATKVHQNDF